jgi:hypothetical protein
VKKSIEASCDAWLLRKVRQLCEGGFVGHRRHIFRDRRFGDVDAELLEFGVDARCAPERVGGLHPPDEVSDVLGDGRSACAPRPGSPTPVQGESTTMPGDDGIRRDDLHGLPPACPDAGQHHPEQAVGVEKTQPLRRLAPEDDELVPQGEDLGGEFETAPKGTSKGGEDSDDECEHSDRQGYWPSGRSATKTRRFEFSVATEFPLA